MSSDPNQDPKCDVARGASFRQMREEGLFSSIEQLSTVTWIPIERLRAFESGEIRPSSLEFVELLLLHSAAPDEEEPRVLDAGVQQRLPRVVVLAAIDKVFDEAREEAREFLSADLFARLEAAVQEKGEES